MSIRGSNDPLVGACRDGDIEGSSFGYRRTISVVDRPSFHLSVVHGIYWMVIVDTPSTPGIPVLRDREYGVGFAVGKPIIEVCVVSSGVQKFSVVNERLGWLPNFHPEGSSCRHRCSILVEDRPLSGPTLEPNTDVVFVGSSPEVFLIRGR
jgi:hypothetical protein